MSQAWSVLAAASFMLCTGAGLGNASQPGNLLVSGDFRTVQPWTANENLEQNGRVTLLPEEHGVMLSNPAIDLVQVIAPSGRRQRYDRAPIPRRANQA